MATRALRCTWSTWSAVGSLTSRAGGAQKLRPGIFDITQKLGYTTGIPENSRVFYPAGHLGRSEDVPGMIRMARARTCYMY